MSNDMKWQMTWNDKWHQTSNDMKRQMLMLPIKMTMMLIMLLITNMYCTACTMNSVQYLSNVYCVKYEKCAWTMHGTGTGSGTGVVVLLGKWSESCFDIVLVCEILVIALSGEVARWITRVGTGEQQGSMRLHWHTPAWCPRHRMQVNWKRKHSRTRQSKLCGFCAFHYWNL